MKISNAGRMFVSMIAGLALMSTGALTASANDHDHGHHPGGGMPGQKGGTYAGQKAGQKSAGYAGQKAGQKAGTWAGQKAGQKAGTWAGQKAGISAGQKASTYGKQK